MRVSNHACSEMGIVRGSRQSGLSTVEFALILPLLLAFLFGTIEFGAYFIRFQLLHDVVRESARGMALFSLSCDSESVENAARTLIVDRALNAGVSVAENDITIVGTCNGAEYIDVSLIHSQPFSVLGALSATFPTAIQMNVTSIARNQNF